jgi:hypothetical protein
MFIRFYVTLKTGRVIVYDVARSELDMELDKLNQNPDLVLTYYYREVSIDGNTYN